jgi:hypothetical protein
VEVAVAAEVTRAAGDLEAAEHLVADGDAGHSVADGLDRADVLVADREPGLDLHAPVEDVQVRTADAGGLDADDRIVGYWTAIDAARQGFHPNLVETIASASSPEALEASGALDGVVEHRSALRADYLRQLATAAGLGYAKDDSLQSIAALATDRAMRREERADRDVRFVFGLAAALLLATEWIGGGLRRGSRGADANRRTERETRPAVRMGRANVPMTRA